jgi:ABC-type phosphate transport system, periplasmic component
MKCIKLRLIFVACILWALFACNDAATSSPKSNTEPVTSGRHKVYKGNLTVFVDEGLKNVIRQQIDVFEYLYDSVKVHATYTHPSEVLDSFRSKHAGVIVITRELDQREIEQMKRINTIYPRQVMVSYDAVAMICNRQAPEWDLDYTALKHLFSPGNNAKVKLVFDNQKSGTVSFVLNNLGYKGQPSENVYALKSADEVVEYCSKHTDAIGFIPYSFISDMDDVNAQRITKRVKILSLRAKNAAGETVRVSANQSDIADGSYPLTRPVNAVLKFGHGDNIEWLFVNFMFKEKGARIFLKAGLIPARIPEREINVNTGSIWLRS